MAQPFSMRYLLVDGQGNFGSVDGDAPAAMRYTEVRMARITQELLADIDKETVDFVPNYDESEREPSVLPTRIPNLLVNGSSGIAVGMATNIPPHNLGEVVDACLALLANPELDVGRPHQAHPGPGLPDGGPDLRHPRRRERVRDRPRPHLRARRARTSSRSASAAIASRSSSRSCRTRLTRRGSSSASPSSSARRRSRASASCATSPTRTACASSSSSSAASCPDVVLNNLFKQTPLQSVFGINMVGLVDGQPKLLSLKEMLEAFLRHRREVVTRRTLFDLRKARERAHILEGLMVALANIDEIIELIKTLAVAGRRARRAVREAVAAGRRDGDARARRRRRHAARGSRPRSRASRAGVPPVDGPGAGDPRPASAPPDGPGAG